MIIYFKRLTMTSEKVITYLFTISLLLLFELALNQRHDQREKSVPGLKNDKFRRGENPKADGTDQEVKLWSERWKSSVSMGSLTKSKVINIDHNSRPPTEPHNPRKFWHKHPFSSPSQKPGQALTLEGGRHVSNLSALHLCPEPRQDRRSPREGSTSDYVCLTVFPNREPNGNFGIVGGFFCLFSSGDMAWRVSSQNGVFSAAQ